MKKLLFLAFLALAFSILAACGGPSNATTSSPTVIMSGATFTTSSVTISKGSTITFTSQGGTTHILVNGMNGRPQPESGAPDFGTSGETVAADQSWTTGPWNTAGTFHVTCTIHPSTMTMTVIVTG